MIGGLAGLALPLLRALEPEQAHELTLRALEGGLYPRSGEDDRRLAQRYWNLDFPNPVGIAAGFDKNARVADAILQSGFGFAEIGTVTPLPQPGNPAPRVFRLPDDKALINRLGFNNEGHQAARARLEQHRTRGVVGVNLGANKDSPDKIGDYTKGLESFWDVASYFTINISSPNTPGLRDLQAPAALDSLLQEVMAVRQSLSPSAGPGRPILVKLSPDLAAEDVPAITETLIKRQVDGIIISNTTLARSGLQSSAASEPGGLSGRPLFQASTRLLARVYVLTEGCLPLIGVGGIDSGSAALRKIEAGASLLQLYTGLVYQGPALIAQIKEALLAEVEKSGVDSIAALVGTRAGEWAEDA